VPSCLLLHVASRSSAIGSVRRQGVKFQTTAGWLAVAKSSWIRGAGRPAGDDCCDRPVRRRRVPPHVDRIGSGRRSREGSRRRRRAGCTVAALGRGWKLGERRACSVCTPSSSFPVSISRFDRLLASSFRHGARHRRRASAAGPPACTNQSPLA
jgi:hypothetical protein